MNIPYITFPEENTSQTFYPKLIIVVGSQYIYFLWISFPLSLPDFHTSLIMRKAIYKENLFIDNVKIKCIKAGF